MDENYLDGLLDELDGTDDKLNDNLDLDSGVDIDLSDMDGISLEELDDLDGMDLSDLDFDDIDFDDVDITNLDAGAAPTIKEKAPKKPKEDMNLDSLIAEAEEQQVSKVQEEVPEVSDEVFAEAEQQMQDDTATGGIFDDQAFAEITAGASSGLFDNQEIPDVQVDTLSGDPEIPAMESGAADATATGDIDELDNLLNAMGGIENDPVNPYTAGEDNLDALLQASMEFSMESGDLDDIEDISAPKEKKSKKKKSKGENGEKTKRSLSEILFGEPDEDDIEEAAYLEEKKAKKAVEKEKKQAEKEAAKAEKEEQKKEQLELKKREDDGKKKAKAEKKAAKDAEYAAELEAEKNAKKVPTAVVIIVFALFAALGAVVYLGSKNFDYSMAIKKATDYFNRKKYHMAYDEVSGVDVKEKDQELKDRIYTVMYVERLYESYENNVSLNRPDKALDALLRGIQKYDEHYEEAVELDIVEDVDGCRAKIIAALWNDYGITEDTAYTILELDDQEYTQTLIELSGIKTGE